MLRISICSWNVGYPTITVEPYLSDFVWQFIRLHDKGHRHITNTTLLTWKYEQLLYLCNLGQRHFFMWKILLLELSAYTITYICAPHTCEFTHQPHPPHLSRIAYESYLPGCLLTRLTLHQSMWQNGGLRIVDKVANELWAQIFSHGCKLFVLGVCHCSLHN